MYPFNRALAVIAYAIVRAKVVRVSVLASTAKRVLKATDVRLGLKTRVPILMRWVCVFNASTEIPGFGAFPFGDSQFRESQMNCAPTPLGLLNRSLVAASKDLFLHEH